VNVFCPRRRLIFIKLCELCGKPITNPKHNQKYHKQGDPVNTECYHKRMRLNWQQASSNYRLRMKKRRNQEIKDKIREIERGELQKSHDGTGGRLGNGGLGPKPRKDEVKEWKVVEREMKRYRLSI